MIHDVWLHYARWWQLKYFSFHPKNWGRWTHFDSYFSDGLKPPTSMRLARLLIKRRVLSLSLGCLLGLCRRCLYQIIHHFTRTWTRGVGPSAFFETPVILVRKMIRFQRLRVTWSLIISVAKLWLFRVFLGDFTSKPLEGSCHWMASIMESKSFFFTSWCSLVFLAWWLTINIQGTIGCTPNVRVPMVFIVLSRDCWGL